MAKVSLKSLTNVYGGVVAFQDLNHEARNKGVLVLLGPSNSPQNAAWLD